MFPTKKDLEKISTINFFCRRVNTSSISSYYEYFGKESLGELLSNTSFSDASFSFESFYDSQNSYFSPSLEENANLGQSETAPTGDLNEFEGTGEFDSEYISSTRDLPETCHYLDRPYGWKVFLYFNFIVMFCLPFAVSIQIII